MTTTSTLTKIELAAPAAPVILVTTAHPTLHQHPGPDGEAVHPRLGRLIQPRHLSSIEATAEAGIPWAADNDCFQGLDAPKFVAMLDRIAGLPGCLFATVPDVVGDAAATLALFEEWAPELDRRGIPAGYVAQDGATIESTPWDRIAAVFIGGSNDYKLGPDAIELAREAKRRGKWVHWGRVNTRRRFDHIVATGAADSFDGSKWARWRKTYLPAALDWLTEAARVRVEAVEAAVAAVVAERELLPIAGGTNEFDELDADLRIQAAELLVLAVFDYERDRLGHDYGGGQRRNELHKRARMLGGFVDVETGRVAVGRIGGIVGTTRYIEPTDVELAAAARRLLVPRRRRLDREDYREHTPATRRTREALDRVIATYCPTWADEDELGEAPNELSDEERREATRIRRAMEERGYADLIRERRRPRV